MPAVLGRGCVRIGQIQVTQRARTDPDRAQRAQAVRAGRCSGTPSRRMRSNTIRPPIGPSTITAIEYFQDQPRSLVIITTIEQNASQIIPWIDPTIALPAALGLMIQK